MSTPPFLELPAGVKKATVTAAGGPLAALVAGPEPTSQRPVLLVPGFTGSKEDFIAVVGPIAKAGHHVVALDLRGQFESPAADDASAYDLSALADDVLSIAVSMGQPVHVVGHSFGGLVARTAAVSEPSALASVTLMSSGPAALPQPSSSNLQLICQALPVMDLASVWAAKRQIETQHGMVAPPAHIEEFLRTRFLANDPAQLMRTAAQLLTEPDRVDELASLKLRALVLFGEGDDAWPPSVQRDMAGRLGADVVAVEGAGHSPAAEKPDETAEQLLGFWRQVESTA